MSDQSRCNGRSLTPIALFFAIFYMTWAVRALALSSLDYGLEPPWLKRVYLDGIRCLVWVVPTLLYVRYVSGTPAGPFLKLTTPLDARGFIRGSLLAALFLIGMMTFAVVVEGKRLISPQDLGLVHWLGLISSMGVGTFAEELLYRGLLIRELGDKLGFTRGNLLTSALFAAIHWPGWFARNTPPSELIGQSIGVFFVGLVAGFLWKTTNSLWPCVGFHLLNNALVSLLR